LYQPWSFFFTTLYDSFVPRQSTPPQHPPLIMETAFLHFKTSTPLLTQSFIYKCLTSPPVVLPLSKRAMSVLELLLDSQCPSSPATLISFPLSVLGLRYPTLCSKNACFFSPTVFFQYKGKGEVSPTSLPPHTLLIRIFFLLLTGISTRASHPHPITFSGILFQ